MGRPHPITGPVLLLMGPLGLFFARLSRYLESQGVAVYKLSLPLHEFGFRADQRLHFGGAPTTFPAVLREWIGRYGIRHVLMYGDYISLHRLALEELQHHPLVSSGIFELGYCRPHWITLEPRGVNGRSGLPRDPLFYLSQSDGGGKGEQVPPATRVTRSQRLRLAKAATFIVHAFQRYPLLAYRHKLQPRPWDLWAQYLGILRGLLYPLSEALVRRRLCLGGDYMLVALQVASDSQIQESSPYPGMEPLIEELTDSFSAHAPASLRLVFKHHPRDRGYNHYGALLARLRRRNGLAAQRLLYLHDAPLQALLADRRCKGLITVSSSVGLEALAAGVPVKLLGDTFFAIPGLVDHSPLAQFWWQPQAPDPDLWRRFHAHLLARTQFRGSFDGAIDFGAMLPVISSPARPGSHSSPRTQSC